jgi:hypothetical protein
VTFDSRPFSWRNSSGGEFSVKKTSAGVCDPCTAIRLARVSSSSLRTLTLIPVCCSNAVTRPLVVC